MAHYGWSRRDSLSPYSSELGAGGVPNVTDEDFSYITSQDLQDSFPGSSTTPRYPSRPRSTAPVPDDDILLIKHKGVTYPAHFPPYCIGDGKLRVRDIRQRIALELDLSDRRARQAKILYKGRQLKEPAAPIRDYGVKNNSEIMVIVSDGAMGEGDDLDEEMVVVDDGHGYAGTGPHDIDDGRKRRKKRSKKPKRPQHNDVNASPHDSASTFSTPGRGSDASRSPPGRRQPVAGPIAKLNEIDGYFMETLYPLCEAFIREPPADEKKREDEHRRISETIMQHVILKLDEVDTNGETEARARRKELIQKIQSILKDLDSRLKA
ncbi:hypothetical protein ACRALDRAFT_1063098 [Sodiomyces alcalophilus JCM 7366]|uniref:uncharacterized protein n=1 Tax=Sodiomyces alcalophilus JCM 7366 TaxID=591952 RepID=UPI0039B44455